MFKKIGPGVLVAAAFIGPGTVTACTLAGVTFGYALLWAMLFSVLSTIILQEMSARLGIITQKGLADVIKEELKVPWLRNVVMGIILAAILIGNAAYEAGNIGGASLGLEAIFGTEHLNYYPVLIGILAFLLLYMGNYKTIEKILVSLVIVMSISFLLTSIITKPNIIEVFKGLLIPNVPKESSLTIIALVGTTVVPYNLFLHASLVKEKWKSVNDLKLVKRDTFISIFLGGLVSIAIMITATSIKGHQVTNVMDLAKSLEPLYGNAAKYFMGIGLFAAGVTSAITAPLAAAYVANSCFNWKAGLKHTKFKIVWATILGLGVIFMTLGIKPIEVIKFAQIANGILLPLIAVFLVWVVNKTSIMGKYKNNLIQNIFGIGIVILTFILGVKSIFKVISLL